MKRTTKQYNFTVIFEPAEEGGYVAICPALPGLVTEGDTLRETRAMARDAIRGYVESVLKDGRTVPRDRKIAKPVKEVVNVSLCRHVAASCIAEAKGGSTGA